MPVPPTHQDTQSVMVVVLIIATLCAIYWRLAIKLLIILIIALAVYGAIETMHL